EEMPLACRTPALIGREPARGDDAVDVGMELEIAGPRVEDGSHAELGAEAVRVAPEREERLCGGAEEEREDESPVCVGQGAQGGGEREDDMEVVDVEDPRHPLADPARLGEALTFRAVAIATRVIRGAFEAARRAHVDVAAEGRRPTDGDRAQ